MIHQGLAWLVRSLYQLVSSRVSFQSVLYHARLGFTAGGGRTVLDPWVLLTSSTQAWAYLPRALLNGLLVPLPWRWHTLLDHLAGIEAVGMAALVPFAVRGASRAIRSRPTEGAFVVVFVGLCWVFMGLTVANGGILVRLRLAYWLPMLILAAGGMRSR